MKNLKEKILKNKEELIRILGAFILGILLMLLFYPDRIAKLENGEEVAIEIGGKTITADTLYIELKEKYAIYEILDIIDSTILYDMYELTDEDNEIIENRADTYISYYEENYNISEEEFLENNGFANIDEFKKYLELDHLRKKYYEEYLIKQISEEEIKDYYDEEVFAPFNVEHILVKITDEVTDSDAKEKAQEILDKLDEGEDWENLKEEYEDEIITESFEVAFDSNLEEEFKNAAIKLKDGKYTTSLVKTSYGYHIIYRVETLEIPDYDEIKERILDVLTSKLEDENENLYEKTMIYMREEAKMDIKDTELSEVYKRYTKDYD